jgi:amino acid adenylation domain-containing protein/non-ribosomal peptide synthase protein (TIGR01720 family)
VVGADGEPLPEKVVGRIQIRGHNVTKGYYGKPASPSINAIRWLDTGDLGFLRNGRLIVTGREKEVLFANGQNLYPEDIERCLSEVTGIDTDRIAVARYEHNSLGEAAAAFVTYRGPLEEFLPLSEMVKQNVAGEFGLTVHEVVPVRRIPRTTSGKVQRVRLGQELRNGEFDDVLQALRTARENRGLNEIAGEPDRKTLRVLEIWREVLGDPEFKAADNFFARRGNSLNAAQAVGSVADEFGIEVPLRLIFDFPVAQQFAAHLPDRAYEQSLSFKVVDHYPLLPQQEALCALQKAYPETTAYNIPFAFRAKGQLDIAQLQGALRSLIKRHSALRTRFVTTEGRLVQRVEESVENIEFTLEQESIAAAELDQKLESFVRPFQLDLAPLFRAKLFCLSETEYVLACDGHHSVLDGLSVVKLLEELAAYYNNDPPAWRAPQFGEYVLRAEAAANAIDSIAAATHETLVNDLAIDFPRSARRSFAGACVRFDLNETQTAELRKLAATQGTTLYVVLLSLYFVLLARLSGQQEVMVATPFGGRTERASWQCIGMFVRTVLLRASLPGRFGELVNHVSRQAIGAFEQIAVSHQQAGRDFFQHTFVFQDFKLPKLSMLGLDLAPVEFPRTSAKCDLCLEGWDAGDRISFVLEYCTSLFRRETVELFAEYYRNLAAGIIANPESRLVDLPILNEREVQYLISGFNDTTVDYPAHETINALFEDQARRTPAAPALILAKTDQTISYAELDESASALAHVLRANGVKRGTVTGILLDRSPEMVLAVLAVLKAGGAYLPLAAELPEKRLALLVKESNTAAIVAKTDSLERLAGLNVPVIDPSAGATRSEPKTVVSETNARDLAYVIYTSGTSGRPKGVMVEHRSVVNYLTWAKRTYLDGDNLNFALHTSLSVDLTVTSLFTPLISGNAVVIYPPDEATNTLRAICKDDRVGVLKLTPTHLKLIADLGEPMRPLRLIVGGENFEMDLARDWAEKHSQVKIYNEYGPTEATVGCMVHLFDSRRDRGPSVPIGYPAGNCQIYLLDHDGQLTPRGARGEICISGDCLARGYTGDQALTAERFVPNPFNSSQLIYRTGDVARHLPGGGLEYLGRRDQQVKIHGYRVSLEEIRAALLLYPGVRDAVVTTEMDANRLPEIVAYLVLDVEVTRASLRAFLSTQLPQHFMPGKFFRLQELPVTASGKLDHRLLASSALPVESGPRYDAPVGETETTLSEIWARVLGVERVGRTDNFFDLGGDSIKALMIASKAEQNGLRISVQQVMQTQTLAALANSADLSVAGIETCYAGLQPGPKPLSPMEVWFFEQEFAAPQRYCQSVLVRFKTRTHEETLKAALKTVVNHHDALRLNAEVPRQRVWFNDQLRDVEAALLVLDLTNQNDLEVQQTLHATYNRVSESFDLANDLLLRPVLLRTNRNDSLLVVAHHLVVDGVSWRILLQDLETAYEALLNQQTPRLPAKTASVKAWSERLIEYGQSEQALAQLDFWRQVLRSAPSSLNAIAEAATGVYELEGDETSSLLHIARTIYKTSAAPLLLTAILRWLRDAFGVDTNLIELEHHGRTLDDPDVSRTVGWFTAVYPLTLTLPAGTVNEQIKSIKQQLTRVPDDVLGYGVLRYIARYEELHLLPRPSVRFNYLGEFGAELQGNILEYSSELWANAGLVANFNQSSTFQIDCLVLDGKLRIFLQGPRLPEASGDELMAHLRYVIDHAATHAAIQFTPLDFDALTLEQRDLDEILI